MRILYPNSICQIGMQIWGLASKHVAIGKEDFEYRLDIRNINKLT